MDNILFEKNFEVDLKKALKIKEEILYRIKQYGDLSNPSFEKIKLIVAECTNVKDATGFLFFLLAFVIVPHPTKSKVSLRENMYNWQTVCSIKYLQHRKIIYSKRRQVSATTLTVAYFLWKSLFYGNTNNLILSLGVRESSDVLSRVSFIYQNLPIWIRTPTLELAKTSITFKNSSRIRALPSSPGATRGQSSSSLLLDEAAFMEKLDQILSAAIPSLGMGFLTEFTNHTIPSQLFLVSTFPLQDVETNEYIRIYKNAIENKDSDFCLIHVSVTDIPEYQDKKWLDSMLETLGPKKFQTEVLGEMNVTMDNSFIPEHVLVNLKSIQPIRTDFLKPNDVDEEGFAIDMNKLIGAKENYDPSIGYIKGLWIWNEPIIGAAYGASVDVGTGTGGDHSTIEVFHLLTGEQVAEFKSNKISLEDFKMAIKDIVEYYNKALLSVERNSMGAPICSYFSDNLNYENFYMNRKSKNNYSAGFTLSAGNKGSVLASMGSTVSKNQLKIKSIRLINELRSFGYNGNGRIMGLNGEHDDLVLALAQFCYLRETFFVTDKPEDYSPEFLERLRKEEEKIRKNRFDNKLGENINVVQEMNNMIKGYSVNPQDYEKWIKTFEEA